MKRKNLALGCGLLSALTLLVCFVLIVLVARGCAGCASGASGAGDAALQAAIADPRIAENVGGVVTLTSVPMMSRNYVNGEWYADAIVFVDGEHRDAEYQATAHKGRGEDEWTITAAALAFDDGTYLTLEPPTLETSP